MDKRERMSKLRTVAKILLMYCIFSSASAFAEGNTKGDPCLAFTCMAESYKVTKATSGRLTYCNGRELLLEYEFTPLLQPRRDSCCS